MCPRVILDNLEKIKNLCHRPGIERRLFRRPALNLTTIPGNTDGLKGNGLT